MAYRLDSVANVRFAAALLRLLTSYTGPLCWGLRLSDAATQDFYPLTSGDLDVADLLSFAGASEVLVFLYDQVSGVKMTVPAGAAPRGTQSGVAIESPNGKPGIRFAGAQLLFADLATALNSDELTLAVVMTLNGATANSGGLVTGWADAQTNDYDNAASARLIYRAAVSDNIAAYRNAQLSTIAVTQDVPFQLTSTFDGIENILTVDGVAGTPVASTGTFNIQNVLLGNSWQPGAPGTEWWAGDLWEVVLTGGIADAATIAAGQTAYWLTLPPVIAITPPSRTWTIEAESRIWTIEA